ncbi:hypothetical protein BACT_0974 [Bifidobacterium actinocoloniiforme DSM 22766]|uniref:DUF58 domain-containing protein n=1 Tax=Bifidobacterium actinocoloniiforme DSM 22766 TaxID=1437605 RepID=A0A086Z172_9BIFI|nr:DUF58 domain-containing protein [Bifidobacterium actinocoloniiforme]AKV55436.1 hypothetical protein AB656_03480 [Bifidobacterium actinocoloniiforme DSM 22766]KFI40272.1 hypothetical protein BACT_0974 [Bifidobacterium actinocoloniiforme DSM 22766]
MIRPAPNQDPIRRKIEALSTQLSLPTVRRALGILEGEHPSGERGSGYDYLGVRPYEPGDESRLIDWRSSARMGRPMITERERLTTSRVWLLMDAGAQMGATTPSGESAATVAANALRMFAALSLRRSDEVSLVMADAESIRRLPSRGGFAMFERTLDQALCKPMQARRNLDALLDYALRVRDRNALVVLATDETAIGEGQMDAIRSLGRTHPLSVVSVATVNPLSPASGFPRVVDASSSRQVPAFLRGARQGQDVDTHRHYQALALKRDLARSGATLIRSGSSQGMFNQFVRLLSTALAASGPSAAPSWLTAGGAL